MLRQKKSPWTWLWGHSQSCPLNMLGAWPPMTGAPRRCSSLGTQLDRARRGPLQSTDGWQSWGPVPGAGPGGPGASSGGEAVCVCP